MSSTSADSRYGSICTVAAVHARDAARAGALLARTFFNDPLAVHLFPNEREWTQHAPTMFAVFARYDVLLGHVDRLGEFNAIATWLGPGDLGETQDKLAQAGFDQLARASVPSRWNGLTPSTASSSGRTRALRPGRTDTCAC